MYKRQEYTLPENRPVFENIVKHLSSASYLSQIIFGLDKGTADDARELAGILNRYNVQNYLIQHNDGPGFSSIYHKLSEAGFRIDQPGKGRNMFMSFGIALAMGAHSIGLVDADIRTFGREQLDRLFYPVQVLNYQFSKAFYARIKDGQFYGRVKRLLLDPLLIALKRKFTDTQEEKVLRLVDFLLNFNYQLSGEVVFEAQLLKRMQFATNWGVEIFTLIEVYRKATTCAQVEISKDPFDHKHQPVSEGDRTKGLYKMGIDIVSTLLAALVVEEGLQRLQGRDRLALLDVDLQGTTQVVVDIRSRFLFETEVFARRQRRTLGIGELNELMLQAQADAYGDGLLQSTAHPYMWALKPHYYSSHFYNWPYTYGLLFGLGLFAQYQQDPQRFSAHYDDALSRAGMNTAEELGRVFGFDVTDGAFWNASLDVIRQRIAGYEALVAEVV